MDLALFAQGANGTGHNALAAADARRIGQALFKGAAHVDLIAPLDGPNDRDRLQLLARCHAAHTLDALGIVPHDIGGFVVDGIGPVVALEAFFVHLVVKGQLLQLTVVAADAGQAALAVAREDQLDGRLAGGADLGGIGKDLHALLDRVDAAGDQAFMALDLHDAHPAGADAVDILEIA